MTPPPPDDAQILDPSVTINKTSSSWAVHDANVTLHMSDWARPKKGKLIQLPDKSWNFARVASSNSPLILLLDFKQNVFHLISDKRLFPGHLNYAQVEHSRIVSAKPLTILEPPTTLHKLMSSLPPYDQKIWLEAYAEEVNALIALDIFDIVSLKEYRRLTTKYGTVIPSNAISTIKFNKANDPIRVKY